MISGVSFTNVNRTGLQSLVDDGRGFSQKREFVPVIRKGTREIRNIFASVAPSFSKLCLYSLCPEEPSQPYLDTSMNLWPSESKSLSGFARKIRSAVWSSNTCNFTVTEVSEMSILSG